MIVSDVTCTFPIQLLAKQGFIALLIGAIFVDNTLVSRSCGCVAVAVPVWLGSWFRLPWKLVPILNEMRN